LSLHAEVAIDYFEVRSADAQERLLNDTVKAYTEALRLTQNRFEGGASPKSDGWFVTWLGFRKENPAADCNFKLSFQPG
jgi:hypothetical protein